MVAGNSQESPPLAGFLAPAHQKPVTAMPVLSSDVQQYMICKSGGAHAWFCHNASDTHARARAHAHTHTHLVSKQLSHTYTLARSWPAGHDVEEI